MMSSVLILAKESGFFEIPLRKSLSYVVYIANFFWRTPKTVKFSLVRVL